MKSEQNEWIKCNKLNALQSQEIIALKDRIKRLEEALDKTTKIASKHIKRLEEAGDAMEEYILDQTNTRFIICAVQWREAKEAKL